MATTTGTTNDRNRNLMLIGGGCAVLALCVCALGGLGAGGYYFYQQSGGGPVVTTGQQPAVEYILDASPRMAQPVDGGSGTRLELARGILAEVVRPADTQVTAGLRVFGNGAVAQPCQDTNLLVPLAAANQTKIADAASVLTAGTSSANAAMAEAMVNAIKDLANTKGPHTLVVITGGTDDCQAQAAETIKAEAARAGITLEQFVVGFQLSAADSAAVKSLVAASSNGGSNTTTYVDAPDEDTLRNILTAIQAHVDQPTVVPATIVQQAATPGAVLNIPTAPPSTNNGGSTPVAGSTSSGPSGLTGQTACDHPYMPLRTGATWTYSAENGIQTWTVLNVTGDQNQATADVQITFPEGSITYHWLCDAQGIRFYQIGGLDLSGSGGVSAQITNEKGVTLPGPALFVPGATWDHSYDMAIDMQGTSASTSFAQSFTAGQVISQTYSYGTFDTITVTGTNAMTISVLNQTFSGTQSMIFGKGVGLIQMSGVSEGTSYVSDLQSYHIP